MENQNYAGFWIRFVAYIIDMILLGAVISIIVFPLMGALGYGAYGQMSGGEMTEDDTAGLISMIYGAGAVIQIIQLVAWWLYSALLESSAKQATVGKMALGLKVVDKNGERLSFGTATLRYIGKIISGMILLIGYIMAAFTAKKQALHDMIASTYVVKK